MVSKPEELARVTIDRHLAEAGWVVQHKDALNLWAGREASSRGGQERLPASRRAPMAPETRRRRNSLRVATYNYAWAGAYFVTICVDDRLPRFGSVIEGEMCLNEAGEMVAGIWRELPERFPFVEIDAFVLMPNHLHGIVRITSDSVEFDPTDRAKEHRANQIRANTRFAPTGGGRVAGTADGTLSRVIQGFKSVTTGMYSKGVKERGWEPYNGRLWQRSFYDHIVRDDRDLDRIRAYIATNPGTWFEDNEYVAIP